MNDWRLTESYQYNGQSIKYGVMGSGPAVVLVHGTPWSSYNLRHLINGLSATHTVYFYDLLGYGQSDKPDTDVSGRSERATGAVVKTMGLEQPFIVGHDFGGSTVLRSHLLNDCRYRKIVLINPVAVAPWGSPFFNHVKTHEAAFAGVPDYIHEAIVRAYIGTAAYGQLESTMEENTLLPWKGAQGKAAFYRQIAQANSGYTDEVQSKYGDITVPVSILWGEEDTWIPVEKGAELHRLIPGSAFHTIPASGHLVIEERPEDLLQLIVPFLHS